MTWFASQMIHNNCQVRNIQVRRVYDIYSDHYLVEGEVDLYTRWIRS